MRLLRSPERGEVGIESARGSRQSGIRGALALFDDQPQLITWLADGKIQNSECQAMPRLAEALIYIEPHIRTRIA